MEKFELTDNDDRMVSIAIDTVRRLLQNLQITPRDIIGLGNAIYALDRLPRVTPGAFSELKIIFRSRDKELSVMRCVSILISDSTFAVSQEVGEFCDDVFDYEYSALQWEVRLDGNRRTDEALLFTLVDDVNEYLEFGAEIIVNDDSQICYEWSKRQPVNRRSLRPLRMPGSRHDELYRSNELIMNIFPD